VILALPSRPFSAHTRPPCPSRGDAEGLILFVEEHHRALRRPQQLLGRLQDQAEDVLQGQRGRHGPARLGDRGQLPDPAGEGRGEHPFLDQGVLQFRQPPLPLPRVQAERQGEHHEGEPEEADVQKVDRPLGDELTDVGEEHQALSLAGRVSVSVMTRFGSLTR
jgi:hypothetical protein